MSIIDTLIRITVRDVLFGASLSMVSMSSENCKSPEEIYIHNIRHVEGKKSTSNKHSPKNSICKEHTYIAKAQYLSPPTCDQNSMESRKLYQSYTQGILIFELY